jgi:hypothetical protein
MTIYLRTEFHQTSLLSLPLSLSSLTRALLKHRSQIEQIVRADYSRSLRDLHMASANIAFQQLED